MAKPKTTAGKITNKKKSSSAPPRRRRFEGALAELVGGIGLRRTGPATKKAALYEAQQLMYQAFETSSQVRRVELAKQALDISPDCADAYVLLADATRDLPEATELNRLGVAAGERALGKRALVDDVGHFWGILETRPYMRARLGLAQCLWEAGKHVAAIEHYRDMLRLNPGDNQGIRYILVACLLQVDRDNELLALIDQYNDDASATWVYTSALLAFRREGDSEDARLLLADAKNTNPHVPAFLSGRKKMPKRLPDMVGFGDESEAIAYVADFGSGWKKTAGAAEWLTVAM